MGTRQQISFSPGPSSSRTPTPVLRAGSSASSSSSRLSKEEIDEILDSPYETGYTYSDSASYKPHIGSRDYVHPQLCRRIPAHAAQSSPASTTLSSSWWWSSLLSPNTTATPRESSLASAGRRHIMAMEWTWTQLMLYAMQFLTTFVYTIAQYASVQIYCAVRYLCTRAVWYTIKYTVLWPILAPYYAAVSYYNKARFLWNSTHNVWTVISWTFAWLTGQRRYRATATTENVDGSRRNDYYYATGVGLRTRAATARQQRGGYGQQHIAVAEDAAVLDARRTKCVFCMNNFDARNGQQHGVGKSLFYLFMLLLLLFAGYTLYGDRRFRLANKQSPVEEEKAMQQIHGKPDQEQLLKLKPSDELHQTHLAQPGTPLTDTVMDKPQLRLTPSLHPSSPSPQTHGEEAQQQQPSATDQQISGGAPQSQFVYDNTTTMYSGIYEHLTRAGQTLWELIVDTFVGTYELLKRIFFVIGIGIFVIVCWALSVPIKFAKMFASFMRAIIASVRQSFKWLTERIAELPFTLVVSPLKDAVQFRTQNMSNGLIEFGHGVFNKVSAWLASLSNAFYEHLLSLWHAVRWTVFQSGHTVVVAFDGISYIGQKVLDGFVYAKNAIVASVNWLSSMIGNTLFFIRDCAANLSYFTVEKVGNTYSFARDNTVHLFWSAVEKIGNTFIFIRDTFVNFFWTFANKIGGIFHFVRTIVDILIWGTIEKVFTVLSVLLRSIAHFFTSICNACVAFVLNIWHSVRLSPAVFKKAEKNDVLLPPSFAGDDHPLVQHFHRILVATLAEERTALEKRLHELAQQQRQSTTPLQTQSIIDENALTDTLRTELDTKMRIEKEELNRTVNHFEEQILSKIRVVIDQMHTQNDNLEHELGEMRKTQAELQRNVEESGRKPVWKKERITQQLREDGRTETIKESTVLMADTKKRQQQSQQQQLAHQFDEHALLDKVRRMIRAELRRFDADRTGLADYALESSGGSVLSTRCTVQYNERSRIQKLFGIPLWYTSYNPRTVIQRKGYGASAGECWAFYGGHGYLSIGLSNRINVTAVSYEHLPAELSPDGQIRSAPRNFLVWSYQQLDEIETRLLLGNFTYDALGGEPLQMFPVQHWDPHGTQIVELETLTNWGAHVTCLYRFRVHGDKLKEIPEVSSAVDDESAFDDRANKRWPDAAGAERREIGGG